MKESDPGAPLAAAVRRGWEGRGGREETVIGGSWTGGGGREEEKEKRAQNDQNLKSKLNQKTEVRQMVTYVI